MATADIYVGRGASAEWVGTLTVSGGTPTEMQPILLCTDEADFRAAVDEQLIAHAGTYPQQGWPWVYPLSHETDFAYALDQGRVWISRRGYGWYLPEAGEVSGLRMNRFAFPLRGVAA